jgi:signal transduction histidine kinase/ligand-binding sensor protein
MKIEKDSLMEIDDKNGQDDLPDLATLIDKKELEKLMEDFYQLTGLGTTIIDLNGNILVGVGRQKICCDFHWLNPVSYKNCLESDRKLTAGLEKGKYSISKCGNNLVDAATPVIIDDVHIGNLFMGQFLFDDDPVSEKIFHDQAKEFGFNEKNYFEALKQVPRISREKLESAMNVMVGFANIISRQSLNNLKLAGLLREKENLNADRNTMFESLRDSLLQNQAFIDSIPDLVFLFNREGIFLNFHTPSKDSLYVPSEEFMNRPVEEVLPKYMADLTHDNLGKLFSSGEPQTYEYEMMDNGNRRFFDARMVLCGKDKALTIVREITNQKKIQQELIIAKERAEESDLLKSAFLANMSHEIRTPMNGIIGFATLLKQNDIDNDKRSKYIDIISSNADHLLSLIDDIIDISKIETGNIEINTEIVNLHQLFEDMFRMFYDRKPGVEIRFLTGKFINIWCDKIKLSQVLSNLIGNAIKFTDSGFVEYSVNRQDKMLIFRVEDTGTGIKKDDGEKIFDRFAQGANTSGMNRGGTGLGLAISKAYIEKMGGKIWFESELGVGTVFNFSIPYIPANQKVVKKPGSAGPIERELTILVADDDSMNCLFIEEIFSDSNINTIQAINGKEAVELCSEFDFDLVLMDMKMPVMDGLEATKKIKALKPGLPVLAVSANVFWLDREKSLKAGCDDYLTKPFRPDELKKKIRELTGLTEK